VSGRRLGVGAVGFSQFGPEAESFPLVQSYSIETVEEAAAAGIVVTGSGDAYIVNPHSDTVTEWVP